MTAHATSTDADLLRLMRGGVADAFAALYRRHQGPLYRFALLRCGSAATAADVVQEAFMGLMTGRFAFDPLRGQLRAFLFGVARNLILKTEAPRRHDQSWSTGDEVEDWGGDDGAADLPADDACPLARVLHGEAAEALRRALARLAPHYRDVVVLYEMHELSYAEIAAICQVDLGTVRSRLSRGRAALARCLAPHA